MGVETDDPYQILMAGTHPIETCLSWRGGLNLRSLLGFVIDYHHKLILFY